MSLGFPATNPTTGAFAIEQMWVKVSRESLAGEFRTGETLVGVIQDSPIYICEYREGKKIAFSVEEILQVAKE